MLTRKEIKEVAARGAQRVQTNAIGSRPLNGKHEKRYRELLQQQQCAANDQDQDQCVGMRA